MEAAGKDWLQCWIKRHRQFSLRENTSAARASGFNKVSVETYFNLLDSLLEKYKFPPSRIYNVDETGITTVPNKPNEIISLKGKKQIGIYSLAERGTTITAKICFNVGHLYPTTSSSPRNKKKFHLWNRFTKWKHCCLSPFWMDAIKYL